MGFKDWIFNEGNDVVFGMWMSDGTIVAYIDGKRYVYHVDPIHHHNLKKTAKFKPWTALNQIKKLDGYGI